MVDIDLRDFVCQKLDLPWGHEAVWPLYDKIANWLIDNDYDWDNYIVSMMKAQSAQFQLLWGKFDDNAPLASAATP
jgi:hypothetical protein